MLRSFVVALAGCLLLVACSESPSSGAGGGVPTGPPCDATPTFHEVLKKPLSGCSGYEPPCHNASAGYLHIDPLDPSGTWSQLVSYPASIAGAGDRVVPYDPGSSFLFRKLTNDLTPKEQDPMPKSGGLLGPTGGQMWMELPPDELETVRCWIRGGALLD